METFFYSILLAAVSALTFVAYKHPTSFRRNLAWPLLFLTALAVVFSMAWFFGALGSIVDSFPKEVAKLPGENAVLAQLAQSLRENYLWARNTLGVGIAVVIYLLLLLALPKILEIDPKAKNENDT